MPLRASPAGLLGRFAPSGFASSVASLHRNFRKKSVSQSTPNGLKRIKMQKKNFTPLTRFARSVASATLPNPAVASLPRASRFALAFSVASLHQASRFTLALLDRFARSGFALCARYLPHVTPRVPRSVHAKVHADWSKTVGARGIHTHTQTHRQTDSPPFII